MVNTRSPCSVPYPIKHTRRRCPGGAGGRGKLFQTFHMDTQRASCEPRARLIQAIQAGAGHREPPKVNAPCACTGERRAEESPVTFWLWLKKQIPGRCLLWEQLPRQLPRQLPLQQAHLSICMLHGALPRTATKARSPHSPCLPC